jgi:NAD-dependent SIR2 family protein deacetylase
MIDWNPIAEKFREADAILIGASNGLSITEGLHLFADNAAFERLFGDFKRKYGLGCILQGMMAGWPSEEEKWAFWARLIHHYCGQYQPTPVMNDLKAIVGEKDYFVVTSNGEGHFELCGFDPTKIYEIEGNWFTMQCARPCHDTLYSSLEVAENLSAAEQGGHVPTELVPRCPKCGGPMDIHMGAGIYGSGAGYPARRFPPERYHLVPKAPAPARNPGNGEQLPPAGEHPPSDRSVPLPVRGFSKYHPDRAGCTGSS